MKSKRLDFFFFGEPGAYDCYSPSYQCNREYAPEILYLIASNGPFSICRDEIIEFLNIEKEKFDDVINGLKLINAIETKDNSYRITFPVFLEEDVIHMEKYINNIGKIVGDKIISMKGILSYKVLTLKALKQYSKERLFYHIICDETFDGEAFDFFARKDVFCTSKLQPGGRDYIIIAYENSEAVEKNSNRLLCSSNNYRSNGYTFNSFGDSNGSRKDVFRFLRLIQKGIDTATPFRDLNTAYIKVLNDTNVEIMENCGQIIKSIIKDDLKYSDLSDRGMNLADLLKELHYIDVNNVDNTMAVKVPVFYGYENETVIREISNEILENIYPLVKEVFENFETDAANLTAVRHKVNIKETANELWHQIFGAANEYLVKERFVSEPDSIDGEGRYLRSITIK